MPRSTLFVVYTVCSKCSLRMVRMVKDECGVLLYVPEFFFVHAS